MLPLTITSTALARFDTMPFNKIINKVNTHSRDAIRIAWKLIFMAMADVYPENV